MDTADVCRGSGQQTFLSGNTYDVSLVLKWQCHEKKGVKLRAWEGGGADPKFFTRLCLNDSVKKKEFIHR